ncbi:MAG: aldo/keto reductase [Erysipelotrichaceae bacterium]|nr:aldo/keto reductase [Erysipelotrichaceae bacterium]
MYYNDFHGLKLSGLGFGCMRFASDPATGEIDQQKVNDMFELAISRGINYFDTAYPYLDGKSENAMAEALSRYPRDSYYLADKFPGHSLPGPVDNIALFNISLQRCRTDYFDFYLLHNVNEWSVKRYESDEYHILPDVLKMKEEGKIRHLGFSFHGGCDLLEELLTKYEGIFEFVQIQCNYLDWTLQDARRKYDIITRHGLAVWVMEPCRGGKLAVLPQDASAKLKKLNPDTSDASYAFRFLQGLDNIKMILSGMNEVFQVEDNLNTFEQRNPVTDEEKQVLFEIAEGLKKGVPCTGCRYCCAGCPMELNIPYLLESYNDFKFMASVTASVRLDGLDEDKRPASCIACGQCAQVCPQGIDVPSALAELAEMYANGPKWENMMKTRGAAIKKDLNME